MEIVSKGKSIAESLIDAGSNLVNNKFGIKSPSLVWSSGITLTRNEIKELRA